MFILTTPMDGGITRQETHPTWDSYLVLKQVLFNRQLTPQPLVTYYCVWNPPTYIDCLVNPPLHFVYFLAPRRSPVVGHTHHDAPDQHKEAKARAINSLIVYTHHRLNKGLSWIFQTRIMIRKYILFAVFLLCYVSGIDNKGEAQRTWVTCCAVFRWSSFFTHADNDGGTLWEEGMGLPSSLLVVYKRDGVLYAPFCFFLFFFGTQLDP